MHQQINFWILDLFRKKSIISFIKTIWPDDQPTPWFRSNAENSKKLIEVTEQLGNDESYIFPKAGLGKKAIKEIIKKAMQERRRKDKDPLSSSSDQESSSSPSPSPQHEKVTQYEAYFLDGKSLLDSVFLSIIVQHWTWYWYGFHPVWVHPVVQLFCGWTCH